MMMNLFWKYASLEKKNSLFMLLFFMLYSSLKIDSKYKAEVGGLIAEWSVWN